MVSQVAEGVVPQEAAMEEVPLGVHKEQPQAGIVEW